MLESWKKIKKGRKRRQRQKLFRKIKAALWRLIKGQKKPSSFPILVIGDLFFVRIVTNALKGENVSISSLTAWDSFHVRTAEARIVVMDVSHHNISLVALHALEEHAQVIVVGWTKMDHDEHVSSRAQLYIEEPEGGARNEHLRLAVKTAVQGCNRRK